MFHLSLHFRDLSPVENIHSYEVAVQTGNHPITRYGEHLLGATCVTDEEVDDQINGLIKELEEIRVAAKRKLKANQR